MGVGIGLGVLIGGVTGTYFLLILEKAAVEKITYPGLSQLLALPTFWFGGPWLAGTVLKGVHWDDESTLSSYILTLAVVGGVISVAAIVRQAQRTGRKLDS